MLCDNFFFMFPCKFPSMMNKYNENLKVKKIWKLEAFSFYFDGTIVHYSESNDTFAQEQIRTDSAECRHKNTRRNSCHSVIF